MAAQLEIIVAIKQVGAQALDKVRGEMMKLETHARSLVKTQNLIAGAAVGGMAVKFVDAYEESRRATERLQQAMANVGASYIENQKHIEETTKALQRKTNFGDDEQVAALAELIPLVGNYTNAMKALPQILDLAAMMQTDLKSASEQYAQLLNGEVPKGLGRLIPQLKDMQKNGASAAEMMGVLNERTKGFAQSDVSPVIQFKNALNDTAEQIGQTLLPAVTSLKDVFISMPPAIQQITVALPALAGALALLGGPVTATIALLGGLAIAYGKLKKAQDDAENAPSIIKNEDFEQLGNRAAKLQAGIERVRAAVERGGGDPNTNYRVKELEQQYANIRALMDKQKASIDERAKQREELEKQRIQREADNRIEAARKIKAEQDKIWDEQLDRIVAAKQQEAGIWAVEEESRQLRRQRDIEQTQAYNDNLEAINKRRLDREARALERARTKVQEQMEFAQSIGQAMAAGIGQGAEGLKESLKAVLTTVVSFIQKQLIAGQISAAIQAAISWNPGPIIKIAAITAAFEAVKAGISQFAIGTPFAGGGTALVGERGPELVQLPRGSQVFNNSQTRNMVTNNNQPVIVIAGGNIQKQLEAATRNKSINWTRLLNQAGVALA
jgi:hypothetical protein